MQLGWNKVTGHAAFDVKMDFTTKARWVLYGHRTPDPEGSLYYGVVSMEIVRIALMYVVFNLLDVFAAGIGDAYLQAPSPYKYNIICGPEFELEICLKNNSPGGQSTEERLLDATS